MKSLAGILYLKYGVRETRAEVTDQEGDG
jgi:hypothetical protein